MTVRQDRRTLGISGRAPSWKVLEKIWFVRFEPTQTFWRVKEIDKSSCQSACSHSYMYSCCKPLLGCEALGNLVLGILLNRIIKGLSMYWTRVSACFQCMNSFQPWFKSCRFCLENTFDWILKVLRLFQFFTFYFYLLIFINIRKDKKVGSVKTRSQFCELLQTCLDCALIFRIQSKL